MSSNKSKSTETKTISRFDRGRDHLLNHFSALNHNEMIYTQLLFFVLLEVLSLKLTDNDPEKSSNFFKLLFHYLKKAQMLPESMVLTARSIRQSQTFHEHVRVLQDVVQGILKLLQKSSTTEAAAAAAPSSSDKLAITSVIDKEYPKLLLNTPVSPISNLSIDIPQADLQLRVPLPLTSNGALVTNDFDNIVIYRYVTDFYELDRLGKGAFGTVFRARNRLDNRMYAIKKIVFSNNTDRIRQQAKCALREVRVLASLSHPNIVQYHCAWLESVPTEPRLRRTSSSSSTSLLKVTQAGPKIEQQDSTDQIIHFEGQSQSDNKRNQSKSSPNSSGSQEDDSENSVFESHGRSLRHQSHSDGEQSSSKNHYRDLSVPNRQALIPFQHQTQFNSYPAKLVLFIQMQLCDTTLYDWLRYRDHTIIEQTSEETKKKKKSFYTLSDLGQRQCWNIFKQLLIAVEYLHSQSLVHRDIKPRNIFLTYGYKDPSSINVKLGDFGLATLFDADSLTDAPEYFRIDNSNAVGTALYAPPEQLNSHHCHTTKKSDSYSLGIVLFELFNIFDTEMERYDYLSVLRIQMKVQEDFLEYYPFESKIIEHLIPIEQEQRLCVDELLKIYSKNIQQRLKSQSYVSKQMIIEQLEEKLKDKEQRIEQLEHQLEQNIK